MTGVLSGVRVVELASAALAGLSVMKVAGPYLERLLVLRRRRNMVNDTRAPCILRSCGPSRDNVQNAE